LNSSIKEGSAPKFDKEAISLELWSLIQLIDKIQIVEKEKSSIPNDLHLEVVHPTPQYMYDKIKLLPDKGGLYLDLDPDTTGLASSELTDPIGVMLQHTGEGKPNLVNVTTAYGKFFGPALPLASDDVKDLVEAWVGENASDKEL